MISPYGEFRDSPSQNDLEIPLSLRDKIETESEVDFFALNYDDFEKPMADHKRLEAQGFSSENTRKRIVSDNFESFDPSSNTDSFFTKDHTKSQFFPTESNSGGKPRITNYVCEIRRLLK